VGFSATFSAVRCPVCGAILVLASVERSDGLVVYECAECGAKVEKRRGEPEPKVSKPA